MAARWVEDAFSRF